MRDSETDAETAAAARGSARYAAGVAMMAASGLCLSFVGLTIRYIEAADGWQILFYRSLAFAATVLAFMALRRRQALLRQFRDVGWPGVLAGASLGASFVCYVFAMLHTTVANVVFMLSAGPFFAALLGWIVLGERVRPTTCVVMAVAMGGIALMMGEGIATGTWLGSLIALGIPATYAVMVVVLRRAGDIDMMPATCLAGVFTAAVSALMIPTFAIGAGDLALSLVMGAVLVGTAFILVTLGARHLPAAEIPLLAMTETVFAPVWVWLFIGEVPGRLTLVGGLIVLGAVIVQAVRGIRGTARIAGYSPGTG